MFVLEIETDSDAFVGDPLGEFLSCPDPGPEVVRILRDIAAQIERSGIDTRYVRDVNGNTVGSYGLSAIPAS